MVLGLILAYLGVLVGIGLLSQRLARGTGEDYFAASRGLGPFVLLMSLVGTHMTAFSILGASGESYLRGMGVFALMASSSALVVPAVFFFVGLPLWRLGKRHGYLTQVQYFRARWDSPGLGLLLFVVLVALLVPYLLIGVKGAGLTLAQASGGSLPTWAGSLLMSVVVLAYVLTGGMRGTAWVNVFQTVVFLALGGATFWVIARRGGGFEALMGEVGRAHPELLTWGGKIPLAELVSYMLIPLSAAMFPHLFAHWLTARRAETFRLAVVAYPFCVAAVWLPSVLLGLLARLDFPNLAPAAASSVLVQMIGLHAPPAMAGVLTAGVFVAVMASTDSQVLALGNMFTQDVVRRTSMGQGMSERRQVTVGRVFITLVVAAAWLLSELVDRSIFRMGIWCFTGFAGLFPLVVAALYWRRASRQGAIASVATAALLWVFFLARGWNAPAYPLGPDGTLWGSGLLPVTAVVLGAAVALVAVSLATRPPRPEALRPFFGGSAA